MPTTMATCLLPCHAARCRAPFFFFEAESERGGGRKAKKKKKKAAAGFYDVYGPQVGRLCCGVGRAWVCLSW